MILNIKANNQSLCVREIPDIVSPRQAKEFSEILFKLIPPQVFHSLTTKTPLHLTVDLINLKGKGK